MVAILDIETFFSNSESLYSSDASHQVLVQPNLRFRRRCRLQNFKMAAKAAILDIGMERFQQFLISMLLRCLPSSFGSIWHGLGDVVWRISRWSPWRYWNGMILAILNLFVTLMPPIKLRLTPTYSLGDVIWRISRCLPWQPSRILEWNKFSNSESPCWHIKFQLNSTYDSTKRRFWRLPLSGALTLMGTRKPIQVSDYKARLSLMETLAIVRMACI